MTDEELLKENEDFIKIQGEYVYLFKNAKDYSREIIKEIVKLNSSPNFSLESLTELEEKLNTLNQKNQDNPYIHMDNDVSLEYTVHDMKYFLGKNNKSKEKILAFCRVFLEKLNAEEKQLILSPEDMLNCLKELNQVRKEDPMGVKNKKDTKKKEPKVDNEVDETTEDVLEEDVEASDEENIETKGEKMENQKVENQGCRCSQNATPVEKKEESGTNPILLGGAILGGVALVAGAGYLAWNYFTGDKSE